jgi:inositol-phosphate phosphatase/L-galactose 1-phosphate phosphatase/histidinol-phosphatase
MQPDEMTRISEVADELADRARSLALKRFRQGINIAYKRDGSPVTVADHEIEEQLRELLRVRCPDDAVYGEEMGGDLRAKTVWIVDPIDGTKSFASGNPLFGCLVGVVVDGEPQFGLIDMPVLAERWKGSIQGTMHQDQPARVSACRDLRSARFYCTSRDLVEERLGDGFLTLSREVAFTRYSGDCYSFGLLASGYCDLCIETGMQPYDHLPVVPVIEGAGGFVSDWSGQALTADSDGTFVAAATRELWEVALEHIGRYRGS